MKIKADNPDQYIEQLPDDRKQVMLKLGITILGNLPVRFAETMNYSMIGYVNPHSVYPDGYQNSQITSGSLQLRMSIVIQCFSGFPALFHAESGQELSPAHLRYKNNYPPA